MANITKRTNKNGDVSYLIRIFVDEKADGTQTIKSMTYKPEIGMTPKQIEKKLNETAVLFEQKIKQGIIAYDGNIKFQEYADIWLDNAQIAPKTKETYGFLLVRINQAIGHIKLQNIQAYHLETFYKNLKEGGINFAGSYAISDKLDKIMIENKVKRKDLATLSNVSERTITTARKGERISIESADKIADALKIPVAQIFELNETTSGLSDKTILHHHRLISAVLGKAKKERIIPFNVAIEHTNSPKLTKKEAVYLDDIQAQKMVQLLLGEEDIRIKTSVLLLLYSGVRRGELCGLEWSDVDFTRQLIHIRRASQWQKGNGITTVPTKNESSARTIKFPSLIFDVLQSYRQWWLLQRFQNGTQWQGTTERLFIQENGKPINPDTINFWLEKFINKNSLPHFTPHSLRHTFATLQIMAGVNIRTVQARTGHAQASTLVNIYSHAIKTADELASDVLNDILTPKTVIKKA